MTPTTAPLFELPEICVDARHTRGKSQAAAELAPARVLMPNRLQMELRPSDLESLLPEGHRARIVWGYVARQDLRGLYVSIKAREGQVGRAAIAPEILLALWLYATLEGVGSARALAKLSEAHDAYRWICGGVHVNHHSLSDFRVENGQALDELLTDHVAGLMAAGVVTLKRVAQDGVRVRASAGAASFRREETLNHYLDTARHQVHALKQQIEDDPGALTRRQKAAQARARREREAKIEAALARLPELAHAKQRQGKPADTARASTTDADASVMKMGDGGFRPAYNGQFATDGDSQVIVGVDAVTVGSDMAQLEPMVEQVETRYGQRPEAWLVDGGYPAHAQLDAVAEQTTVYAPVPEAKTQKAKDDDQTTAPHTPKAGDSPAVAAWRERMGSDEAKAIYKVRAATAECVNAQARNRGLLRLPVRGTAKVKCVLLLFALAHNLMRTAALAPALLGTATSRVPLGAT